MGKKKKIWLIVIGVILAVLILVSLSVYFGVNMLFSVVSESFYQSAVVITESGGAIPGGTSGTENAPGGAEASPDVTTPDSSGSTPQQSAGTVTAPGSKVIPFDRLNLTMEEFKALQQQVPFSDKVAALSILSAGLSATDYTELFSMLSGGITSDEVRRAYKIISRGLSSEDKEKIWGYYEKYKYLIQ